MSSAHLLIVARHDATGKIELPLDDITLYGVGGEDRVLLTACARYGPEWTLSLYAPFGSSRSGTGAGEVNPQLFAYTMAHIANHPPFVSGIDYAKEPDRSVTWTTKNEIQFREIEMPFVPTAHLRWNDQGQLEQKWTAERRDGREEDWRLVPQKRQFEE